MDRRTFFTGVGTLVLSIPAARLLTACGGDGDGGGGGGSPLPTTLTFTSSLDDGHSHQVTLAISAVEDPPAEGVSRTTTQVDAHVHEVSLTEADLQAIEAGETVNKTTTVALAHDHTFAFRRSGDGVGIGY